MPLHDLVSLGEADSAAFLFGGEVKLKNFVLDLRGDAAALVADFGDDDVLVASCGDAEGTSKPDIF